MRFLSAEMETFEDGEQSGEGRGTCTNYLFTVREDVDDEKGMTSLRWSRLR